jgi:hypothetical protein
MTRLKISFAFLIALLLAVFFLAFFLGGRIYGEPAGNWKHIVTSDGRGYYAYLPALFIDGDLTFSKLVQRESRLLGYPRYKPGYLVNYQDKPLNKYFAGEALLLLPFFLAGLLLSYLFGTPVDGYSFFFQFLTGIGSLFYLIAGLWFLIRILEIKGIKRRAVVCSILLLAFGTNLFYYGLWQQTMSHIFSFFAINGFLFILLTLPGKVNTGRITLLGLFFGLVALIRPTNVVILLLIPFFINLPAIKGRFMQYLFSDKRLFGAFLLPVVVILAIQPTLWYLQTGQLFIWPYTGEGFRFGDPHVTDVLFSFEKGFFIYTPAMLLAIPGLFMIGWNSFRKWISMLLFLVVSTYVIASWWNWYYGDGFGLRALIDYYGIYTLLIALFLDFLMKKRAGAIIAYLFTFTLITVNLIQTWQYSHRIMQPNSMNREKYCHIFLRTDSAVINNLGGNKEMADFPVNTRQPVRQYRTGFESADSNWNQTLTVSAGNAFSGLNSGYIDSVHTFSPGLAVRAANLGKLPGRYFVEGNVMVYDSIAGTSNQVLLVLSMQKINGSEDWWQGFRMNDIPVTSVRVWRGINFSLMLPEITNRDGILKIYLWNTGKGAMLIDDFDLRFFR